MDVCWGVIALLVSVSAGLVGKTVAGLDVVHAVNCGGDAHVDYYGIQYRADKKKVGTASDFGRMLSIARAHPNDQTLYQTERYHHNTFSYDVSMNQEGDYVLVLKFSEVYFSRTGQKVFNVQLNGHTVVQDLDVFERVGKGVAHDEIVPFRIHARKLYVGETSMPFDGKVSIHFVKGKVDNPKVNAFYIAHGRTDDIPKLPDLSHESDDDDVEERQAQAQAQAQAPSSGSDTPSGSTTKFMKTSGPALSDPYASDEGWLMPLIIALAVFIPTLFCLCRL